MAPPRLRIWAECVHNIYSSKEKQGIQCSTDETQTNIIGNEGITLEDDLAGAIHTEWLDSDGLPLPADMGADFEKRGVILHGLSKSPKTQLPMKTPYCKITSMSCRPLITRRAAK